MDATALPDTRIRVLGAPHVPFSSPDMLDDNASVLLQVGADLLEQPNQSDMPIRFEQAGPRSRLYFDPRKVKAAVVTCGGICPGINDVIRSIVMTLKRVYKSPTVFGIRYGLQGLVPAYGFDLLELDEIGVHSIHESGGTMLGTSRGPQDPAVILNTLESMNVNMLFVIGGDGTMKAAGSIEEEAGRRGTKLAVIGIPKTIDNDINFIPQSFGFETAVSIAAEAVHCAATEAASVLNGVGIVKLMGRESGFIAAHAGLAQPEASFVLVPEVPFAIEGRGGLLETLEARLSERSHAVIVVAEGAGQALMDVPDNRDRSGNRLLGDIAGLLATVIPRHFKEKSLPCYIKYIDPSYMIRSVPANANDRVYCALLGQHAVHAAMAGRTGMVVGKLGTRFLHLPLPLVTCRRRTMNPHSDLWRSVMQSTGQGKLGVDTKITDKTA